MVICMKTDCGGEVTVLTSQIEAVYLNDYTPPQMVIYLLTGRSFMSSKELDGKNLYEIVKGYLSKA